MLDISFPKFALPAAGSLVLLLAEDDLASGPWQEVDEATGGAVLRALQAAEFKGKKGQVVTILAPGAGLSRVVAIGIGLREKLTSIIAETTGANVTTALFADSETVVDARALTGSPLGAEGAADVALGAVLRAWRFDKYRTTEKPEDKPKLAAVSILSTEPAKARAAWTPRKAIAEGVFLARTLVSEPPNVLFPTEMADRCVALEKLGVEVDVLGPKEMKKHGMGAILGVAQGSVQEPRIVVMRWNGLGKSNGGRSNGGKSNKKSGQPLCFIGKGVTFDTGGISIKPAGGMEDMKWDMAGAGTVIGLMAALAGRKAKVDVVGLVGLVENMPSGSAQRPGDVVKTASGQTVEVINTDAEGRLVLADVLWYAQQKFEPKFMVDLATLTGAIIVALGHEHAGLFSNDDMLSQQLTAAGTAVGEALWRMPLGDAYDKQIRSDIADMKNVGGGRAGGSITAAQFIQRYVESRDGQPIPWAHLDIAGTAWSSKDQGSVPKGATAFGVRLLDRLVADHYEG